MTTLEQVENGAHHYDIEEAKALYEAKLLRSLGSNLAEKKESEAKEYARIARELRALAESEEVEALRNQNRELVTEIKIRDGIISQLQEQLLAK